MLHIVHNQKTPQQLINRLAERRFCFNKISRVSNHPGITHNNLFCLAFSRNFADHRKPLLRLAREFPHRCLIKLTLNHKHINRLTKGGIDRSFVCLRHIQLGHQIRNLPLERLTLRGFQHTFRAFRESLKTFTALTHQIQSVDNPVLFEVKVIQLSINLIQRFSQLGFI